MLEVAGLSKSFGGLKAVQDVSFTVRAGEILGIIGPNGAGKTTLFNLLNGILQPDAGQVDCMGRSLRGMATNRIARLGIGRTFQVARPFPRLSVLDNVAVGAYVATESDEEAYALARAALDKVALTSAAHLAAGSITTHQIRRLELARALAGQPKLLLLDETLAGPDRRRWRDAGADPPARGRRAHHRHHRAYHACNGAAGGSVHRAGSRGRAGAGHTGPVTREPAVIEAYLGKKWSARANA
jgi:branched-chain amino acid transport system permease protein